MLIQSGSIRLFAIHSGLILSLASSLLSGCAGSVTSGDAEDTSGAALSFQAGQAYSLVRDGSGKCMDVGGWGTSDGTNIIQWSCHGGANQRFRIDSLGGAVVRLVDSNSGKCVDVAAA